MRFFLFFVFHKKFYFLSWAFQKSPGVIFIYLGVYFSIFSEISLSLSFLLRFLCTSLTPSRSLFCMLCPCVAPAAYFVPAHTHHFTRVYTPIHLCYLRC